MHVQTHILSGWCIANCFPLTPRQRLFSILAASLPDLDGLGYLISEKYYVEYHHVVCHNLFFAILLAGGLTAFSTRRLLSFLLYFSLVHLHLVMDYYGSGRGWTIDYFWPVSNAYQFRFLHAWRFDSWQNLTTFAVFLAWALVIAIRPGRTPLEALMPRLDRQLVALFQRPFARVATLLAALILPLAIARPATAAEPPGKPVPLMQAIPLPHHQVSFQRDGRELCRYWFDPQDRRPFIFPVIGPSGRSLTRMGHPHDPETHSHHNSVWISHHDVDGLSFWSDQSTGRIVHQRIDGFEDADDNASMTVVNHWTNEATHTVLLIEHRRIEVRPMPDDCWMLILDLHFESKQPVTLGKTAFGPIGVRMAKSIDVNDSGGEIRNSEGASGEKAIFWKPARWVDYSGPITRTAIEGITLMDHRLNPGHPTPFHVRSDGWMGASLTLNRPITIAPEHPLSLRYGLYVHAGKPSPAQLDAVWKTFCGIPIPAQQPPGRK